MTDKKKDTDYKKVIKTLSKNYWAISTVVLALLLIATLISGGASGPTISAQEAGQKLLSFANNQGAEAELVSSDDNGLFYEVVLSIEGQQVPLYVTKDGKSFTQQLTPLSTTASPTTSRPPTPAPTNIPKTDKPVVELFIMSICPYGTQMEKGMLPVVDLLGDNIDFQLKFVYYAMHDKPEIDENVVQYCVQKEAPEKLTKYLSCYLEENNPATWNACIAKTGIDETKIEGCVAAADSEFGITAAYNDKASWLSGRFPKFPIDAADNEKYGVGGSPTLIINGAQASSGRDAASILNAVCAAFNNAPAECSEDLSSLGNPAPGFGFGTQGGSASAAGCGI